MNKKLTVVLLCAGNGRRMKSHGSKSLIQLTSDENIIQRQIRVITTRYPKAEIIVVVGFQAEKVIKCIPKGVKIVENEMFDDTSSVRSALLALRICSNNNLLLINGDMVFDAKAIEIASSRVSAVLVDNTGKIAKEKVGLNIIGSFAGFFSYGFPNKWGQLAFLTKKEFEMFTTLCEDRDKKRILMFEVFNFMIEKDCSLKCLYAKDINLIEIDSYKDIYEARKILA